MSAEQLLSDLRSRGFTLSAEGAGIRIRPASRLTPELGQAIVAHRAELLELLRRGHAPAPRTVASAATDLAELADWFAVNAGRLPQVPFGLVPGRRSGWAVWVADPPRFYAALRMDLAAGPAAARARTGALAADLLRLRALVGD